MGRSSQPVISGLTVAGADAVAFHFHAAACGGCGFLGHGAVAAVIHAHGDFVYRFSALALLDFIASHAAANGAQHGHGGLAAALAHLVAQYATNDPTGHGADARTVTGHADGAYVVKRAAGAAHLANRLSHRLASVSIAMAFRIMSTRRLHGR